VPGRARLLFSNSLEQILNEVPNTAAANSSTEGSSAASFLKQQVARLSMWSYARSNGTPYNECEEPSEGFLDSHCTLMELIEEARRLVGQETLV
jgi:hypothetical protein